MQLHVRAYIFIYNYGIEHKRVGSLKNTPSCYTLHPHVSNLLFIFETQMILMKPEIFLSLH